MYESWEFTIIFSEFTMIRSVITCLGGPLWSGRGLGVGGDDFATALATEDDDAILLGFRAGTAKGDEGILQAVVPVMLGYCQELNKKATRIT
jgi:hypothetical protein